MDEALEEAPHQIRRRDRSLGDVHKVAKPQSRTPLVVLSELAQQPKLTTQEQAELDSYLHTNNLLAGISKGRCA
jgi:hypothetical protein